MRARLPELHPRRGLSTGKGAVSPMDQMIDHPTIERTSSEGTSGERTGGARRRPAARTWMVGAAAALALLLVYLGSSYYQRGQATAPPAAVPSVTVSKPLQRDVDTQLGFLGQFSAIDRVELRAQVGGTLTEIHFQDGQIVHKGDLLFVIDPRPYEIQLEQANAQFQTALATAALANKLIDRSARLNRAGVASDERLDERTQGQRAAAAAIKLAEAAVHAAQLNLEFTRIVAPFTGRVSRRHVSIGSLITGGPGAAGSTELTTIVSLDPVYLDFDMSEADYAAYQRSAAARPAGANAVQISLDGERPWSRTGDLDFLDNEIDRRSG